MSYTDWDNEHDYCEDCGYDYDDCNCDYDIENDEPQFIDYEYMVVADTIVIIIKDSNKKFTINLKQVPSIIKDIVTNIIVSKGKCELTNDDVDKLIKSEIPQLAKTIVNYSDGYLNISDSGIISYINHDGKPREVSQQHLPYLLEKAREQDRLAISKFTMFYGHLVHNYSSKIITRLFDFLQCNSVEITEYGFVRCFKAITSDHYDCHSGTNHHEVGKTIEMERGLVNDDDTITCSHGLHVCSINYLTKFYWTNNKVLTSVLVNPCDFVSIPVDYNDSKARVCRYIVENIYTQEQTAEILGIDYNNDNTDSISDDDNFDLTNLI